MRVLETTINVLKLHNAIHTNLKHVEQNRLLGSRQDNLLLEKTMLIDAYIAAIVI